MFSGSDRPMTAVEHDVQRNFTELNCAVFHLVRRTTGADVYADINSSSSSRGSRPLSAGRQRTDRNQYEHRHLSRV